MHSVKVIVVGAGPSGVSAALTLLRAGVDCLLMDHAHFPREKVCGGLLTDKSIRLIKAITGADIPQNIIRSQLTNVDIVNHGNSVLSFSTSIPFSMCIRSELDSWLLKQYMTSGGKFISDTRVIKIISDQHIVICSNGEKYHYEYIIGADGVNSCVRRYIPTEKPTVALGVEVTIPTDILLTNPDKIVLDVGLFKDGYLWVFPKHDVVTIGFAFTYCKDFDYVKYLKHYLKQQYNYTDRFSCKGAFLPYGIGVDLYYDDVHNIYLVGDAGGFTDPITGEGIYYALLSGQNISQAIIAHEKQPCISVGEVYSGYNRNIRKQIKRSYLQCRLFYLLRPFILRWIHSRNSLLQFYCDHQIQLNQYDFKIIPFLLDYFKQRGK